MQFSIVTVFPSTCNFAPFSKAVLAMSTSVTPLLVLYGYEIRFLALIAEQRWRTKCYGRCLQLRKMN